MCQDTCQIYAECKMFFFLEGLCTLYSGDYRDECGIIGGHPDQFIEECVNSIYHGCDVFLQEECEYDGHETTEMSAASS